MLIEFIENTPEYEMDIKVLLDELQKYLVSVDTEHVQIWTKDYGQKYYLLLVKQICKNNGKIYLALSEGNVIGLIAGYIEPKDQEDLISNRCPKRGIISDLVVTTAYQKRGIGKALIEKMEKYFVASGCEFVALNVFAPNKIAAAFYENLGFQPRNIEEYKKIGK